MRRTAFMGTACNEPNSKSIENQTSCFLLTTEKDMQQQRSKPLHLEIALARSWCKSEKKCLKHEVLHEEELKIKTWMKSAPQKVWPCLTLSPFLRRHAGRRCWEADGAVTWTTRDQNLKSQQGFRAVKKKMNCALPLEPFFCPSWEAGVANVPPSPDFRQRWFQTARKPLMSSVIYTSWAMPSSSLQPQNC